VIGVSGAGSHPYLPVPRIKAWCDYDLHWHPYYSIVSSKGVVESSTYLSAMVTMSGPRSP
jgi:hypothetical protein